MGESLNNDGSFTINRKWISNPNSDLLYLKVPENLTGRKVLEIFTGREEESMKRDIEFRGGNYFSLDRLQEIRSGKHVRADVFTQLPFKQNTFDYVLLSHPLLYSTAGIVSERLFFGIINSSIQILKTTPGSMIGIMTPLSYENVIKLCDSLKDKPEIADNYSIWFERTDIPLTDDFGKTIPKEYVHIVRVIKN